MIYRSFVRCAMFFHETQTFVCEFLLIYRMFRRNINQSFNICGNASAFLFRSHQNCYICLYNYTYIHIIEYTVLSTHQTIVYPTKRAFQKQKGKSSKAEKYQLLSPAIENAALTGILLSEILQLLQRQQVSYRLKSYNCRRMLIGYRMGP